MLTVFIATHNGADTLPATLSSLERLHHPSGGWQLVVVDNNSNDRTAEIVAAYHERLPMEYRFERQQGKNHALNSALERLEGDLAVFTDDDVCPEPDWLSVLRKAADEHPEYGVFAGKVVPRWPDECPEWIKSLPYRTLASAYAATWPHLERGPLSHGLAFGPNLAIRRHFFDEGFRFDPGIGPKKRDYAMGSESEFLRRLADAGAQTWYCPEAVVEHIILGEQTSASWLMGRAQRQGRGKCWLDRQRGGPNVPMLLRAPRWMWRKAAQAYLAGVAAKAVGRPDRAFALLNQAHFYFGYIRESRRGEADD